MDPQLYRDSLWFNDWHDLPGGWSIQCGEIGKFFNGEEFHIEDDNTRCKHDLAIDLDAYWYYYQIWENWKVFNMLPNGGNGWLNELPWVIDVIKYFEVIHDEIVHYRMKKR